MKVAILADIHGNFQALKAVLADISRLSVDRIFSLGDNIGYGPEPEEVVQSLIRNGVHSVMGNHELGLASSSYSARFHVTARDSLHLTRSLLSAASLAWLTSLPAFSVWEDTRFVHGCPPESMTVYLFNPSETRLQRVFAAYPESICFAGHIHDLAWHRMENGAVTSSPLPLGRSDLTGQGRHLFLCGSVGQPRDMFNWHAKYVLWDQAAATIEVRDVEYDVQTTVQLLKERGFPGSNAKRLFW
ncbi:MAG: metallophosphoesterase [Desulfobulbus sp.]|nr:metallophosphoesterase [Desulfobulbus sp.]